jgi:predicted HTH transcriptional regulator
MNTNDGILSIGVEDDKTITGIEKDLANTSQST